MKKFFRILSYTFIVLLFLGAILIGMSQTDLAKEWVRQFAENEAAKHLNGELTIGEISGTFITGLKLKNVEWQYENERAIHIPSIDISINPIRLLHNEILIHNVVLMNPDVRLIKDENGVLNISRIVKKRESGEDEKPDTLESKTGERWVYRLENLEILGGSFIHKDRSESNRTQREYPVSIETVDFGDLNLRNLYLTMSAISDGVNHSVDIRSLNFSMSDPVFIVSHFSLQAAFSPGHTQINRLRLITDRSNINITGGIADYNLLGRNEGRVTDKEMNITLLADRFHFDDLKKFIPAVWFLEGDAKIDMATNGILNDKINVEHIGVKLGRSELALAGTLNNVTDGSRLFIDASFTDSRIDPADVNAILPHYPIPDYSHLGILDVAASFNGMPRKFNTTLDLHTSAGLFSAAADLDLTGPAMVYDASLITANAGINTVMQNTYLPNDLSGRISLKGEGTNLNDILADARLEIEHMKLLHLEFDSLATTLFARNHDLRLISTGYLTGSEFSIDARSDIGNLDDGPFDVILAFKSLDLAPIMQDSSYISDLTFSLTAKGTGLKPESMVGEAAIELEPSRFREYEFVGEPVFVSLEEIDESFQELNIRSEIVDVYLAGEFDIPTIAGISFDHLRQLISTIGDDIQGIVTGETAGISEYSVTFDIQNPLDTVYDIDIKNMNAIAIFLGRDEFDIEVEGKLFGYFRARDNMLHLGGDIEIDHFMYISENERMLLDKVFGWYNIDNDYKARGLEGIFSVFDISASGIYTQSVNVNNARIRADIKGTDWNLYSSAVLDTFLVYEIDALAHFDSTALRADISTLSVRYGDIDFKNLDTLQMRYDNAGVWFDSFTLHHNEASKIDINGLYAFDRDHAIVFNISNIDLTEIHRLAVPEAVQRRQPLFSGSINIVGNIGGTTEELQSDLNVRITDIEYGELSFGIMKGRFEYSNTRLDFTADISEAGDTTLTVFRIAGYMPFDVFPGSDGDRVPDGPINIHLFSEGFDLSIIDPFLSDFRNFRAKMTSDVLIMGTVEEPLYEGNLEISGGEFVFERYNVKYYFSGEIEPRQNELIISRLRLENRRRDLPEGRMNFSGSIRTRGLTIRDFDLYADGQLLVLRTTSRTTRRAGDFFYGDLTIATGTGGLRLSGDPEESNLSGALLIRSADLVFPPARTTAYDRTGSIINYIAIEDLEEDTDIESPLDIFFRDIAQRQSDSPRRRQSRGSFIDGLNFDIIVQTDGRVEMTMIFNQATGEELVARIETSSLRLYSDELTGIRLVGNVDIVEPSAYSFYRKFDARGRISFVGPPDNPELDITATYAGQRVDRPVDPDGLTTAGGSAPIPVVVRLHITGDRYEPKLDMNLLVNNEEWEGDVETDAISFILTGRFQSDMGAAQSPNLSADFGRGIPATFMSGVATSLLSSVFTEFLRNEVRFIRTAEIVYYGGNIMDTAELRISGELRNFYWTIGGRVFNDIGNTNFSFQVPMGPVFNSDRWTNLFLELERRSQSIEYSEYQRPVNAARLYYSISF